MSGFPSPKNILRSLLGHDRTPARSTGASNNTSPAVVGTAAPATATASTPAAIAAAAGPSAGARATAVAHAIARPTFVCDWAVEHCAFKDSGGPVPQKCQREGCKKYLHHVCAIEWATAQGLPEGTISSFCRSHHPFYLNLSSLKSPPAGGVNDEILDDHACNLFSGDDVLSPAGPAAVMEVGTVTKTTKKGVSPIISTANKVNAITAKKKKFNKNGEVVQAVKTTTRINPNRRVYAYKRDLIRIVKNTHPKYDRVESQENSFRFWGTVVKSDKKKGFWHVEFDMLRTDDNVLVCLRRDALTTVEKGTEEKLYDHMDELMEEAINDLEKIGESDTEFDCDLALNRNEDGDDEEIFDDDEIESEQRGMKKKKKMSKKVESINSFLRMTDDEVKAAVNFNHFYGEGSNDFISWEILKDGDEITKDVMQHPDQTDPFCIDIPWQSMTQRNDYFAIFFMYFFPSLKGKAALLDKYLNDERCSYYRAYTKGKLKYHRPEKDDPDYIVSSFFVYYYYLN